MGIRIRLYLPVMINLYKLEIFNTVAEEGSFSQAARRLRLSQPAVSQHMRDLEHGLGVTLFERTPRGAALTTSGETLLDYTRCILRLVAEAEMAVTGFDHIEDGHISIGGTPGASVYLLPKWIKDFHVRHPALGILLRTDTTENIAVDLRAGKLDLGLVEGELRADPPLKSIELQEIKLMVVVGKSHAWWQREAVALPEIDGQAFITRPVGSHTRAWIDAVLEERRIQPKIVAEFDNPEAIKQAVATGMGITILPEMGFLGEQESGTLRGLTSPDLDLTRSLKLVWNDDHLMRPVSRAFLTLLSDTYPQVLRVIAPGGALRRAEHIVNSLR